MKFDKARPGQEGAINTIIDRVTSGKRTTSIILPTGYGKSDVIRASAIHLKHIGAVCCSLVIVPNEYLRGQTVERDAVFNTAIRFGLPMDFKYRAITSLGVDYAANGESFLSVTIQLVQMNVQLFVQWVKSMVARTGKPVAIFVDEVHTHTTLNEWGRTLLALERAGAIIIVLTATPNREDGAPPYGFTTTQTDNKPIQVVKVRPGQTPETVFVQIWEGSEYHYTLEADYAYTFKSAYDENVLCHVSRDEIDADISIIDPDGKLDAPHIKLSDLKEKDVRRVLGKAVRHPDIIRRGCEIFVQRIREVRRANPALYGDCAGIVFTASDEGTERNEHAEQIKAVIRQIDPSLKVVIATSADDDNGKKNGRSVLEGFVLRGEGDVLIVKAMAGLGLDAPRIKVSLDLSPVRSPIAFIQRTNRMTRPYKGALIAHLVTLADKLQQGCFEATIAAQGGAVGREIEMVKEYERDKKDPKDLPLFMVHGPETGDMADTKRNRAHRDDLPIILRLLEELPIITTVKTFPEIAEIGRRLGLAPSEPQCEPVNTGAQLEDLRAAANGKARDLIKLRFFRRFNRAYRGGDDSAAWGALGSEVWLEAKRRAEIALSLKIERITDIGELERLRAALDFMIDQEMAT